MEREFDAKLFRIYLQRNLAAVGLIVSAVASLLMSIFVFLATGEMILRGDSPTRLVAQMMMMVLFMVMTAVCMALCECYGYTFWRSEEAGEKKNAESGTNEQNAASGMLEEDETDGSQSN